MTEPEWMEQLEALLASVSDESAQRFSAACCRRNWDFMNDSRHRAVVVAAEQLVDGRITRLGQWATQDVADAGSAYSHARF